MDRGFDFEKIKLEEVVLSEVFQSGGKFFVDGTQNRNFMKGNFILILVLTAKV
jgi:hypothetical protein